MVVWRVVNNDCGVPVQRCWHFQLAAAQKQVREKDAALERIDILVQENGALITELGTSLAASQREVKLLEGVSRLAEEATEAAQLEQIRLQREMADLKAENAELKQRAVVIADKLGPIFVTQDQLEKTTKAEIVGLQASLDEAIGLLRDVPHKDMDNEKGQCKICDFLQRMHAAFLAAQPQPRMQEMCGRCSHTRFHHADFGKGGCQVPSGCDCFEFVVSAQPQDKDGA